jgi:hypothetical protein
MVFNANRPDRHHGRAVLLSLNLCYNDITATIDRHPNQVGAIVFLFTKDFMTDSTVLRELLNARFDALEAKITSMSVMLEKENDRQDEAIERLAERTTHTAETKRLTERVIKIEGQIEAGRDRLNDLNYKVKVTWAAGSTIGAIFLSILGAVIKGWIGV